MLLVSHGTSKHGGEEEVGAYMGLPMFEDPGLGARGTGGGEEVAGGGEVGFQSQAMAIVIGDPHLAGPQGRIGIDQARGFPRLDVGKDLLEVGEGRQGLADEVGRGSGGVGEE